jgi:nucleoid-associated protein YgaU
VDAVEAGNGAAAKEYAQGGAPDAEASTESHGAGGRGNAAVAAEPVRGAEVRVPERHAGISNAEGSREPAQAFRENRVVRDDRTADEPSTPNASTAGQAYLVRRGDNLHKIAKQFYGQADLKFVRLIEQANPRVRKRAGKVLAGETLTIPAASGSAGDVSALPAVAAANASAGRARDSASQGDAAKRPDKDAAQSAPRQARGSRSGSTDVKEPGKGSAKSRGQRVMLVADADKPSGSSLAAKPVAKGSTTARSNKGSKSIAAAAPQKKSAPRSYRVRPGDSLERIAARELRDAARWPEIRSLNKLPNGDRLLAGTLLKLPPPKQDG